MSAPPNSPIRILLVDDHELFREGLARLLASDPGLQLIAQCGSIPEAVSALCTTEFDLILLDVDLGLVEGTELLRRLPATPFQGRVLVITAGVDDVRARELLSLGVAGIFLKHNSPALLVQSIRQVMDGYTWIDQHHMQSVLRREEPQNHSFRQPFTAREKQVLRMVLEGRQNKEIAAALAISESGAKALMQQLFNKTGVRTRSQLVRVALEQYRDLL
jgi:two-component system nitrate/nitrite response regulator NarL